MPSAVFHAGVQNVLPSFQALFLSGGLYCVLGFMSSNYTFSARGGVGSGIFITCHDGNGGGCEIPNGVRSSDWASFGIARMGMGCLIPEHDLPYCHPLS